MRKAYEIIKRRLTIDFQLFESFGLGFYLWNFRDSKERKRKFSFDFDIFLLFLEINLHLF